jgi:hypothetical protein
VVTAAVAVAVHREQDARLDLGEPVDDAPEPEVGRAARPGRPEAGARVESDDRLDDVRQVADDAVARADTRPAKRCREAPRLVVEVAPGRLDEGRSSRRA